MADVRHGTVYVWDSLFAGKATCSLALSYDSTEVDHPLVDSVANRSDLPYMAIPPRACLLDGRRLVTLPPACHLLLMDWLVDAGEWLVEEEREDGG